MKLFCLKRRGSFLSTTSNKNVDWCKDAKHSTYNYIVTIIGQDNFINPPEIILYHKEILRIVNQNIPVSTCENMIRKINIVIIELLEEHKIAWEIVHIRLYAVDLDLPDSLPKANMEYCELKNKWTSVNYLPLIS